MFICVISLIFVNINMNQHVDWHIHYWKKIVRTLKTLFVVAVCMSGSNCYIVPFVYPYIERNWDLS